MYYVMERSSIFQREYVLNEMINVECTVNYFMTLMHLHLGLCICNECITLCITTRQNIMSLAILVKCFNYCNECQNSTPFRIFFLLKDFTLFSCSVLNLV